jgi:hypothetical protein
MLLNRRLFLFLFRQALRRTTGHFSRLPVEEIEPIALAEHVHPDVVNGQRFVRVLVGDI